MLPFFVFIKDFILHRSLRNDQLVLDIQGKLKKMKRTFLAALMTRQDYQLINLEFHKRQDKWTVVP